TQWWTAPSTRSIGKMLGRLFLARQCAPNFFHPRRKAMAVLFTPYYRLAGNPVKLNHATRPRERLVTVPRIIASAERPQPPFRWRNLENHVVEIISGTKQPKPTTGRFPTRVHIDQDRDDFRLRIGMDFAVFFAATTAHGDHVGSI